MLFAGSVLQVTDNQVMPLLVPGLERGVWTGSDGTDLLVAYALGAAAGPLLVTGALPRLAGRTAAVGAMLVLGAAAAGFAALPGFPAALALRAVSGAASGVLSYALLSVAVATGSAAVHAMTAGFLTALVAGAPGGAILVHHFGVPAFFLGVAGCALVLAAGAAAVFERVPIRDTEPPRGFLRFLERTPQRNGIIVSVAMAMAISGPMAIFPGVLAEGAALDQQGIGLAYLAAAVGPLLALAAGPVVRRRAGVRSIGVAGALLLAGMIAVLPLAGAAVATAIAVLVLALLVETIRRSAIQEIVASLAADQDRARYLALRGLCVQAGIAAGIAAAARVEESVGFGAACLAAASLAVVTAPFVPAPGRAP